MREATSLPCLLACVKHIYSITLAEAASQQRQLRALAIFDFDCTLTRNHLWGRFKNAPLQDIPIDEDTFVDMVRCL